MVNGAGQGLNSLVQLVDQAAPDRGQLAGRACNALWAALEAGGPRAMVMRCRAAAACGLPLRLVRLLALLLPDLLHGKGPDLQVHVPLPPQPRPAPATPSASRLLCHVFHAHPCLEVGATHVF